MDAQLGGQSHIITTLNNQYWSRASSEVAKWEVKMSQGHLEVSLGKELPAEGKTLRRSFEEKEKSRETTKEQQLQHVEIGRLGSRVLGEGGRHQLCSSLGSGQLLECLATGLVGCA